MTLQKLKDQDFRQSVARLQQASGAAVTTLLKLMIDPVGRQYFI